MLKHDQPALLARTNSGESNGPDNALVPVVIRQILTAKHPHGADDGLLKIEGRCSNCFGITAFLSIDQATNI